MKARIITEPARLYSTQDLNTPALTELPIGTEIELGGVKKKSGASWVEATLANGVKGFVPGGTKVYTIKLATLQQNEVTVYSEPSTFSVVKAKYKKKTKFYLNEVINQDGQAWIKIRDLSGAEGYIDGKTKVVTAQVVTKSMGKKNMVYGALWFIGGIIVTVGTYSAAAASGGGTYFVTWGAIIFGAIQFIQGFFQYLNSPN
ncbi:MAG TPA: SH3 domain-containing protein [Anaerolineales bacterium]|nr:SH3 domain-containing protein [Anaerolineales bacterium]